MISSNLYKRCTFLADYKYSLYGLEEGSAEREEAKHEAHVRCANRLQALCFKNGGIYIKLGQHIGQLVGESYSEFKFQMHHHIRCLHPDVIRENYVIYGYRLLALFLLAVKAVNGIEEDVGAQLLRK